MVNCHFWWFLNGLIGVPFISRVLFFPFSCAFRKENDEKKTLKEKHKVMMHTHLLKRLNADFEFSHLLIKCVCVNVINRLFFLKIWYLIRVWCNNCYLFFEFPIFLVLNFFFLFTQICCVWNMWSNFQLHFHITQSVCSLIKQQQ